MVQEPPKRKKSKRDKMRSEWSNHQEVDEHDLAVAVINSEKRKLKNSNTVVNTVQTSMQDQSQIERLLA